MILCAEIKVRGYHLDIYGHINNSRYLELFEEARWALFERHVKIEDFSRRHLAFNVVNANINYRAPATMGDVLEFYAELKKVGNRSATLYQEARIKGSSGIVADADVTFVLTDMRTAKAVPLDSDFLALLDKFRSV